MKRFVLVFFVLLTVLTFTMSGQGQDGTRWRIQSDGSIAWTDFSPSSIPHRDHLETSGERISAVLRYGVNAQGAFELERSLVWPMLRTIPNNTHASLNIRFKIDLPSKIFVDGAPLQNEKVCKITLNGFLETVSFFDINGKSGKEALELKRKIFPSTTGPFLCERFLFKNRTNRPVEVTIPEFREVKHTDKTKGVAGSYTTVAAIGNKSGSRKIEPGQSFTVDFSIQGFAPDKQETEIRPEFDREEKARESFIREIWSNLVFDSPEPTLNTMFAFAKIRASESIFRTAGGLMHGPGGESYYAAIWANDQAEYVNPFFPYLGYSTGNESALNSYRHFARFMNKEFKPIPSSIIAEGTDIWNGAGDRGDAAMLAYGAARYALVRGNRQEAQELWPLISWCLEYCRRHLNRAGVVESDCDELENRFPAGSANLCTSTLYYDALQSATVLGRDLGMPDDLLMLYSGQAASLRRNIEKYFGAKVAGFETYRYYDGATKLRSWICMPLIAGINDRAKGTIDALFSDQLWTKNGLLTEQGSNTFWDRATLYALRGVFAVGATEKGLDYLRRYSATRLLGEHVPYPIEAWPEGNQRHLSAESGLYCRVFIEGLFGIRPDGLSSFTVTPRLPKEWKYMAMKNIRGFGKTFDLRVERKENEMLHITLNVAGKIKSVEIPENSSWHVQLDRRTPYAVISAQRLILEEKIAQKGFSPQRLKFMTNFILLADRQLEEFLKNNLDTDRLASVPLAALLTDRRQPDIKYRHALDSELIYINIIWLNNDSNVSAIRLQFKGASSIDFPIPESRNRRTGEELIRYYERFILVQSQEELHPTGIPMTEEKRFLLPASLPFKIEELKKSDPKIRLIFKNGQQSEPVDVYCM